MACILCHSARSAAIGVALHDTGKRAEAIKVLEAALARYPYERTGDVARARTHAPLLRELEPENADFARRAGELGVDAATRR